MNWEQLILVNYLKLSMIFLRCLAFSFNNSFSCVLLWGFVRFQFYTLFSQITLSFDWPSNTMWEKAHQRWSLCHLLIVSYLIFFFMVHSFTHRVQRFVVHNAYLCMQKQQHHTLFSMIIFCRQRFLVFFSCHRFFYHANLRIIKDLCAN